MRSRWTTPAEWTYFNPRCGLSAGRTGCGRVRRGSYHDLVQEVLNELRLEWSRREEAVEIRTEKLGDKVAEGIELDVVMD